MLTVRRQRRRGLLKVRVPQQRSSFGQTRRYVAGSQGGGPDRLCGAVRGRSRGGNRRCTGSGASARPVRAHAGWGRRLRRFWPGAAAFARLREPRCAGAGAGTREPPRRAPPSTRSRRRRCRAARVDDDDPSALSFATPAPRARRSRLLAGRNSSPLARASVSFRERRRAVGAAEVERRRPSPDTLRVPGDSAGSPDRRDLGAASDELRRADDRMGPMLGAVRVVVLEPSVRPSSSTRGSASRSDRVALPGRPFTPCAPVRPSRCLGSVLALLQKSWRGGRP